MILGRTVPRCHVHQHACGSVFVHDTLHSTSWKRPAQEKLPLPLGRRHANWGILVLFVRNHHLVFFVSCHSRVTAGDRPCALAIVERMFIITAPSRWPEESGAEGWRLVCILGQHHRSFDGFVLGVGSNLDRHASIFLTRVSQTPNSVAPVIRRKTADAFIVNNRAGSVSRLLGRGRCGFRGRMCSQVVFWVGGCKRGGKTLGYAVLVVQRQSAADIARLCHVEAD